MAEAMAMPFGFGAWMGHRNHVLDGGPAVLRDVAMATSFGKQCAINGFVGYKFGSVITSDTLFDSMGGFSESSYPMKT